MRVPGQQKKPVITVSRIAYGAAAIILCCMGYILIRVSWYEHGIRKGTAITAPVQAAAKSEPKSQQSMPVLTLDQVVKVAKALDPEAMQNVLPAGAAYDPAYKNPCWKVAGSSDMRCLPYVYIMGSFQAGAGTLYDKLSEHPDIVTNDFTRWQFWAEDTKPMREYVEKHGSGRSAKELDKAPSQKVILDASASTFAFYWSAGLRAHRAFQGVMMPCWQNCTTTSLGKAEARRACMDALCYPKAMAADQEAARILGVPYDALHVPLVVRGAYGAFNPKLIVVLRDPIQRLHTAYWEYAHYHGKYGRTAEGFLAYVKEQVDVLNYCTNRHIGKAVHGGAPMDYAAAERHCALYLEALGNREEGLFFHADQFIRGMYAIFLEVWLRHFPRQDVLVLKGEDEYYGEANSDQAMLKVFRHLGLSVPTDEAVMKKIRKAGKPHGRSANVPAMLPEAKQILQKLYKPYNDHLARLLQDDRWLSYNA